MKAWCIIPSKMSEELSLANKEDQFEFAVKYLDSELKFEEFSGLNFYRVRIENHDGVYI